MDDVTFLLSSAPDQLATLGEAMGRAGIAFEGGGMFATYEGSIAHFLVRDGQAARNAAEHCGITVQSVRPALIRKLRQGTPGQLGAIARALADVGIRIEAQYSDHSNNLILICDDPVRAAVATAAWNNLA